MREYAASLKQNIESGTGIVLTGPAGTGKDHLIAALFTPACSLGFSVRWTSGAGMFSRIRDAIQNDDAERMVISKYTACDVLALSDPQPITGALTQYQQTMLYAIIEARYNDAKPTWVTVNAKSYEEAADRIGGPIVDRLRHGAMCLACDWPSFRKSKA